MFADDDDVTEALSGAHSHERGDHRLNERKDLKKQIQSKEQNKRDRQKLLLRTQIEKQKSDQTVGTKTREEQIKQETRRADTKENPETVLEEAKRQEHAERQARYEETPDNQA
jgi:hypothetical protein